MGQYSIKQLEALSGIKAHTLRIWEKRYELFQPLRSEGNQRIYGDEELRKLLNIAYIYRHGVKPSEISNLNEAQINERVLDVERRKLTPPIERAIIAIQTFDEWGLSNIINSQVILHGFEKVLFEFICPLLERIGILWQTKGVTVAHEHFASNIIRQKIVSSIDQLPPAHPDKKTCLLFLPEGEIHELGLMMTHYMLKRRFYKCLYLGANVPLDNLIEIQKDYQADYLVTSATNNICLTLNEFFIRLNQVTSNGQVLISGALARDSEFGLPEDFVTFKQIPDIAEYLEQ